MMDQTADRCAPKWTAREWELSWGAVSRRLMGAPADVRASATMQGMAAALDRAFEAGDASTFCGVGLRLCLHCDAIIKEKCITSWWKIPPRDQATATDSVE